MKKITILSSMFLAASMFFMGCEKEPVKVEEPVADEFLAPTTPMNRVAVLEDFTGVRCGYCPDGHVRAKALADANPGKVIIIAVHAGSYAAPASGWANFTSRFGEAIDDQAAPIGYPAGTINRIVYTDLLQSTVQNGVTYKSKIAMSRGSWATAAGRVFAMSAPVNLGAKATYDAPTRELKVKVDIYYTEGQTDENRLNIALVQDHLFSKQSGGSPDANNYEQNHVLRDMLTGQWGEAITETKTTGSKISKTFTYKVPENYNGATIPPGGGAVVIDDLKVIAFITKGQTEILNALEVDVK